MMLYIALRFRTFWYMSVRFGTFRCVLVQKYLHIDTFICYIQVYVRSFLYIHILCPLYVSASLRTIRYDLVSFGRFSYKMFES